MVAQVKFRVTKAKIIGALVALVIFAAGIGIGWYSHQAKAVPLITPIRDPQAGYSFINPILYTDTSENLSFPKYTPLNNAIASYVNSAEAQHKASDIAVYFRDLNSNNWVGINYTDKFDAASMLKVVTLIALLRASETQPSIMQATITVPASYVIPFAGSQDFAPPTNPATSGHTYAVQDLMTRMITQSDNGSDSILVNFLGDTAMTQVFNDLHIPPPGASYVGVSPQEYSHLFRVLYNASYLTSPDSETALKLLSETTFTQGLVAGVPAYVTVAHKFGESTYSQNGTTVHELHDCGIVYYPSHPYFLCVMTRGTDFPTLAGIIQDLSNLVWTNVNTVQ